MVETPAGRLRLWRPVCWRDPDWAPAHPRPVPGFPIFDINKCRAKRSGTCFLLWQRRRWPALRKKVTEKMARPGNSGTGVGLYTAVARALKDEGKDSPERSAGKWGCWVPK